MVEEITLIQQLLVRALLDDLPLIDRDYIIGIADGTLAVGDDKACPTLHQIVIIASPPPFYYYNFSVPSNIQTILSTPYIKCR
jgi:hypothetical protein